MVEFFRGLRLQSTVIGALIMREVMTRYGRDNLGFVWVIVEPMMFTLGVLMLWRTLHGAYNREIPIVPFTLLGYSPLLLFRHGVSRSLRCISANRGLLFHRRVSYFDLFVSRIALEFAGNLLSLSLTFAGLAVFGLVDWPKNFPLFCLGYFHLAWFTFGISMAVGALSERTELVEKIWTPVSYLMLPVCGCYALAEWLPTHYRAYYLLMPTVSAFEMIRSGYFGPSLECYWNETYITYWSAIPTLLGLYLFRHGRKFSLA